MRITSGLSEAAVLQELGSRIARHRLESGFTQAVLAVEAGVAKRTLERIEAGHSAELATVIRLLRVLKLIDGLEGLVPDQLPSPMALLKSQGRRRRRIRARKHSTGVTGAPATSLPIAAMQDAGKRASPTSNASNTTNLQRSKRNKHWTWSE
jgi:transcriptional regulator with XRE-family HTH domain